MEFWLILALTAAIAMALYAFMDNYIADVFFKGRAQQSQVVFFGPAYLITVVLIAVLFPIQEIPLQNIIWLILAGIITSLALIPYFKALGSENTTGITIFEQISPIFYLIFGRLILGESISGWQLASFAVILAAPILIILTTKKRSQETELKDAGLMAIKVICTALANILIVKFGGDYDFVTMLFFVLLGKGLSDTCLSIVNKKWRKRFGYVAKQNGVKFYGVMLADHLTYLAADFSYYVSLIVAPSVAMASVVSKASLPVIVFVFGIVLTILWPNFGREKMDKRTVRAHLIATTLAVVGIILMQLT